MKIIGHRGASADAPENTLVAFSLALQQGADGVECDVYLTRDNEIICLHDPTTGRTCNANLAVRDATVAQLKALDAGSWKGTQWTGERIPTLRELLALVPPDKMLFIEVKDDTRIVAPLTDLLRETTPHPELIVMSFDAAVVAAAKRALPELRVLLLEDFREARVRPHRLFAAIPDTLTQLNADGVGVGPNPVIPADWVQSLHQQQRYVNVWTVDDATSARRHQQAGVDSLATNRPGALRAALANHTQA